MLFRAGTVPRRKTQNASATKTGKGRADAQAGAHTR